MLYGRFLGGFRLSVGSQEIGGLTSSKSRGLIAYLMLNADRQFGRQQLAEIVWGESYCSDIMKALRQELWLLRRSFKDARLDADDYFIFNGDEIGLSVPASVDAVEFETSLSLFIDERDQDIPNPTIDTLEAAIALYRGDLLPGLYDHWCLFPREVLRDKYIIAVERMMAWHAELEDWATALLYAKRLLDVDPLLEHVHRDIMRFHYARGDRPAALRQYAACRNQLRRDLTIEPMVDTTKLYQAIREENDTEILRRAHERWGHRQSASSQILPKRKVSTSDKISEKTALTHRPQ
jgi:DNA-binding SARP family transcriptional activator